MTKFKLQVGDTQIEIEGATREEAIRKLGLNPRHWQDNRGEIMEIKETKNVNKQQSTVVTPPKKRPIHPPKVEVKPASYRRKSNITTEDIGRWYTDGTDVWKLDDFIPEPQVTMSRVASLGSDPQAHEIKKGNLSDFKEFRRLIPETERGRRPRKQR